MSLHPEKCFCESCMEPSFADPAYPDFERKFPTPLVPAGKTLATSPDPTAFGGVVIQSLTQYPTPKDPEILSLDLPVPAGALKHMPGVRMQQNLFREAQDKPDGIVPTKKVNDKAQEVAQAAVKKEDGKKKLIKYAAIGIAAYLLVLRKK